MKAAITGSFDPITCGHLDVIERARRVFDELVIGVGVLTGKQHMFDLSRRVSMVEAACADMDHVEVYAMDGLAVDFCGQHEASVIVRGARSGADFESEWSMARMNMSLARVETMVLPASESVAYLSSSYVRSVILAGGDVTNYVPASIAAFMKGGRDG